MILCRDLTITDVHHMHKCVLHHTKMYGIPIDHHAVMDKLKYILSNNGIIVGSFINDQIVGICSQWFWEDMPVWSLSNLFVINNPETLLMTDSLLRIIGSLMEHSIKNAEKRNIFDLYYVIRDSVSQNRKNYGKDVISESNSYVADRYEFTTMHVLKSPEDVKWKYIKSTIGEIGIKAISPPYNKILNMRRGTIRPEFRIT